MENGSDGLSGPELVERGTRLVAFLQEGRIAYYLLYSFVTLITLLVLTRG